MSPEALAALRGSIAKWQAVVDGSGVDRGTKNCPLCAAFYDNEEWNDDLEGYANCHGCPVFEKTGQDNCGNTPYETWSTLTRGQTAGEGKRPTTDEDMIAARAELAFLISLLPEGEAP